MAAPKCWFKYLAMTRFVLALILGAAALTACSIFASNDTFGESWKGEQIERLERQWKQQGAMTSNLDGTKEYRFDIFHGGCTYYFTTDPTGKIIAYRYDARGWGACKPIG